MLTLTLLDPPSCRAAEVSLEAVDESTGVRTALTGIYSRSAAERSSADYSSALAARIKLTHGLSDWGSIGISTGISRDQDALEERNVWSSTTLAFSSHAYDFGTDYLFRYSGSIIAPTNSDSRKYLSYRGTFGLSGSISREFKAVPWFKSYALEINGGANRNFFKYDASLAGIPNTVSSGNAGVRIILDLNDVVSLSSSFVLEKSLKSNGSWNDTIYRNAVGANARITSSMDVNLSQSNRNRAFSYDYETTQIALYDYETTVYELAVTYQL